MIGCLFGWLSGWLAGWLIAWFVGLCGWVVWLVVFSRPRTRLSEPLRTNIYEKLTGTRRLHDVPGHMNCLFKLGGLKAYKTSVVRGMLLNMMVLKKGKNQIYELIYRNRNNDKI